MLLISIIITSSAYAATPFQTTTVGMQIDYPKYDVIKQGNEHRFHVHVINETSSKTNRTTSCIIHLYNQTGYDITWSQMEFESYNGLDFAYTVPGNNFTTVGVYSYVIQCNSSNQIAFASGQIEVNPTGIEPSIQRTISNQFAIFSMFLVSLMLFMSFMFINNVQVKFSVATLSAIFFLIGINLILNSLTNEVVDPKVLSLFDVISAGSYYFYWLGGGIVCILLILASLNFFKESVEKNKIRKYGGLNE